MNNMAWKAQCTEFFSQYKELLEDFNYSLEEFKETLNALESCVDFKEYEELEYCGGRNLIYINLYVSIMTKSFF